MKIEAIETLVSPIQPNVTIVRLHDDEGRTGLGETFYGAGSVEAHVHDVSAPVLLRLSDASPEAAAAALPGYVGYQGSGTETRAGSAIDIALWDLLAQRVGLPLRELLGGPTRRSIPVYNTCAGNGYVRTESRQSTSNWGLAADGADQHFEDLDAFLHRPGQLARELIAAGFGGMKIWPFDPAAEASGGDPSTDLKPGLDVLEAIRSEVGDDIDIYLELHSLWTLAGAARLLRHLEPYQLSWVEDPLRPDRAHALARLGQLTHMPIAAGESLAGARSYQPLLESGSIDVAIVDLGWCGGLTEARKIAALAALYDVLVAPHDCTGPISLAAAIHWVTSVPNGLIQEMSRAFYHGWYTEIVEELPPLVQGRISPLDAPGLGIRLRPEFMSSPHTRRRVTRR